jgi:tight adherence protein B
LEYSARQETEQVDPRVIAVIVFASISLLAYVAISNSGAFYGRYRDTFTTTATFNLSDMFMFMDARKLFMANVVALVILPLFVWLATGNPILGVGVLLLLIFLPRKAYAWMRQRRIDKIQAQLPDGLMMIASSMRAGLGFAPALESLARDLDPPLSQEFSLVLREQRMGIKPDEALGNFNQRVPIPDVTLFVSAVGISRDVGGNLAESMASLSDTLRRRLIMEGKVKALTAQGRLQGIVMALLPVSMVTFLTLAYPETMQPMFHTVIGWGVVALAGVMEFLGYKMCRKIMSIDV